MGSCRQSGLALWVCVSALAGPLFAPQISRAQGIVAVTNDDGEKVYVNDTDGGAVQRRSGVENCRHEWCTGGSPKAVVSLATTPHPSAAPSGAAFPAAGSPALAARTNFDDLIDETASRHHVDPQLVEAVVRVESEGNTHALSSRGAQGLMQLIPATAQRLGVQDPYDPRQNLEGGVSYLRYLLDRFGGDVSLALAGYNAGENSVARSGGVPPFKETQAYVRKVNRLYGADAGPVQSFGLAPASKPAPPLIYRYVDDKGVVHYTNE